MDNIIILATIFAVLFYLMLGMSFYHFLLLRGEKYHKTLTILLWMPLIIYAMLLSLIGEDVDENKIY